MNNIQPLLSQLSSLDSQIRNVILDNINEILVEHKTVIFIHKPLVLNRYDKYTNGISIRKHYREGAMVRLANGGSIPLHECITDDLIGIYNAICLTLNIKIE